MLFQRTETQDKQPASIGRGVSTSALDWKIVSVLLIAVFLLWIFLYSVTSYNCYQTFDMCTENSIVLWSVPVLLVGGIVTYSSVKLIGVYHESQRKRLANAIDEHYDYRNVDRTLEARLLDIAHRLAESYGTAEVDTWSPSGNYNTTSIKAPDEVQPTETKRRVIPIDDFMSGLDKES